MATSEPLKRRWFPRFSLLTLIIFSSLAASSYGLWLNNKSWIDTNTLQGQPSDVPRQSYIWNDQKIAIIYEDGSIRMWNVGDGALIKTIQTGGTIHRSESVNDNEFIIGFKDRSLAHVYDWENGELLVKLKGHTGKKISFLYSLESNSFNLIGSIDDRGVILLWDTESWICTHLIPLGFAIGYGNSRISKGTNTLTYVKSSNDSWGVWDLRKNSNIQAYPVGSANDLCFGKELYVELSKGGVVVRNIASKDFVAEWNVNGLKKYDWALVNQDQTVLAYAKGKGTLIFDALTGKQLASIPNVPFDFWYHLAKDKGILVTKGQDNRISLWDLNNGNLKIKIPVEVRKTIVTFIENDSIVSVKGKDGNLYFWNIETAKCHSVLKNPVESRPQAFRVDVGNGIFKSVWMVIGSPVIHQDEEYKCRMSLWDRKTSQRIISTPEISQWKNSRIIVGKDEFYCLATDQNGLMHLLKLRRPEAWFGITWLWEFWTTLFLGIALLWSCRRDWLQFRAKEKESTLICVQE